MNKRKLVLANNPLLSGPAFDEREKAGIPYREILISNIQRDPNQPRVSFDQEKLSELSESIKTYGVLSPVLVKPTNESGKYILIAGERRFRAAQLAGLTSIPALVDREKDDRGDRTLAMQLVENLQRSDLTPLERAHAIGALKETYNLSIREVADKLGISKAMVQRSLDILDLPDDLMNALREGASESKILLLANIEDQEIRASYLKDLDVLTRNQLKNNLEDRKNKSSEDNALTAEDLRITDEIQHSLGMKVKMTRSKQGSNNGKLTIDFYSDTDLQVLFRKLIAE